jgi:hypothetical protein
MERRNLLFFCLSLSLSPYILGRFSPLFSVTQQLADDEEEEEIVGGRGGRSGS